MLRLRDQYRMASALRNGDHEVFFQFPEEDRGLHPEDWGAMERAWEIQELDIEICTDAGLLSGKLHQRLSYEPVNRKKRFEVTGCLIPTLPQPPE